MTENYSTFKIGDRVVALEDYSHNVKKGETYMVLSVCESFEAGNNGVIALKDSTDGIFGRRLKLAEEETVEHTFKVGDLVDVLENGTAPVEMVGVRGKVLSIQDKFVGLESPVANRGHSGSGTFGGKRGWWLAFEHVKLAETKPQTKKQSQKITIDEVQVGDLIVAFVESEGVEYRRKGIAGEKDWEGDWKTEEGGYLTYFVDTDSRAQHIYLLERPEPKVPEIADGTYWVTEEGHPASPWKVTVKDEVSKWEAANGGQTSVGYSHLLAIKNGECEDYKPITKFHTEDPTPKKELTDLEKFEQAGYIGPKYRLVDGGLDYKVTAKGNVKNRFSDRSFYTDGWDKMNNGFEWFESRVKSGDLIEI